MSATNTFPQRKIIHIDMDCFYAAVEMRDNPEYRDIPLAIGGKVDRRSVLSTCNYLARSFGVHSAMPSYKAKQLCPELLIIPGRMQVYIDVSKQIKAIYYRYTDLVEPLSLDEAFLDVTDCKLCQGSATYIAEDIRRAIFEELNLTASAGVASVKFLAKIASDENKPNGICVITPDQIPIFIKTLPLKKIPGVGKVAQKNLAEKGLVTCADVQQYSAEKLLSEFGKLGGALLNYSRGIDSRAIEPYRERKSLAVEHTFSYDILGEEQCSERLVPLFEELTRRLDKVLDEKMITKIGVKIKFSDFNIKNAERQSSELSLSLFSTLLHHLLHKSSDKPIRLLGISVGLAPRLDEHQSVQLNLLE
ncbi:DNA polymerase IV [Psychromonas sp. Urea-02u-13]|uniref:DNA polymerase IV n=1 Tax=Psychromonas sp. Urea-02u-13 TaxID=2058326 RepID=UPI000C3361C7|nr:DNA polymerase IV [Psychromonas sp. Urea-02u-13]PKG40276.1 DNA polymerase IV [Psychromonas sp. Urea-02u-13]